MAAALAAWRARTLTITGAAAGWSIGVAILYGTGWEGGAVLAAFFVSSNLISRAPGSASTNRLDPKSDQRDHWQVYANGAVAAAGAMVGRIDGELGLWLLTISLAAAAADTWATAAGRWSAVPVRLVWSGEVVPAGTNGGMTPAGTAGAVAGALIISAIGAAASGQFILLPAGTLIGFVGMVADSMLGAFVQGRFHCPACNAASEWRIHRCGGATRREGGIAWLNNDGVNLLATALAGGGALVAWYFLSPSS
ncbi:MAG TPA: DUF92 domain-containing protein [Gemmatimonadales bacterium]|nr:DUF92 domain-containing protein [Gemmatimonadales bacterium]